MEKRINIAELIKDCPAGTKFYSPIFGDVYLNKIRPHLAIVVTTTDKEQGDFKEEFLYDGRYGMNGECMLFPSKDQRDWSKFQIPFKDGDVIFTHANCLKVGVGNTWISIFKEIRNGGVATYVDYCENEVNYYDDLDGDNHLLCMERDILRQRLATEEEKEKLFDAIKANGYTWNSETKTLEKLIEPKFKVGDKIIDILKKHEGASGTLGVISEITDNKYIFTDSSYIPISSQDNWELVPDEIKPRFKVGDKVKRKNVNYTHIVTITEIDGEYYGCVNKDGQYSNIYIKSAQDNWELVSDEIKPKFKVGDKVKKHGDYYYSLIVTEISVDCFITKTLDGLQNSYITDIIPFSKQDEWELVPNKFDITTLVPFESRVLVRDKDNNEWRGHFFSHYDNNSDRPYVCIGVEGINEYKQCIPYKCNEYLLGKIADCDEYYKTWE